MLDDERLDLARLALLDERELRRPHVAVRRDGEIEHLPGLHTWWLARHAASNARVNAGYTKKCRNGSIAVMYIRLNAPRDLM